MKMFGARVIELDDLRSQRKALDRSIYELQDKIIQHMEQQGIEQVHINNKMVTVVRPTKEIVDELGLRDEIDYETWRVISHRVYDPKRAEVAIEDNLLSIDILKKYIHISPLKPYVKITEWGP